MIRYSSAVPGAPVLAGAVPHRLFLLTSVVILSVAAAICIVLLVGLVLFFAFWQPDGKGGGTAGGEAAKALAKSRSDLLEIRQLIMRLKNRRIRRLSEETCEVMDRIIRTLREQPEDIPRARQFFNYYLPTLGEILRKYRVLEDGGVSADDTAEHVASCLEAIRAAMEKQYESLFDNDKLDLTVEMEVLKQMCQRDGLLTEDEFRDEGGGQGIALGR